MILTSGQSFGVRNIDDKSKFVQVGLLICVQGKRFLQPKKVHSNNNAVPLRSNSILDPIFKSPFQHQSQSRTITHIYTHTVTEPLSLIQ